jgi:hypothetical protein
LPGARVVLRKHPFFVDVPLRSMGVTPASIAVLMSALISWFRFARY